MGVRTIRRLCARPDKLLVPGPRVSLTPKDDKRLVIYGVFGIVLAYMLIGTFTALAGLFGIA